MKPCHPPKKSSKKSIKKERGKGGLQEECVKYLNTVPRCKVTEIIPGPYGSRGVSDLLICLEGKFVAVELKTGKDKPTPLQAQYLDEIEKAGGRSFVCRSLEEVKKVITSFCISCNFV